MKKIIRLTESDLTRIVKKIVLEQSEHVKNLYKSWANKKSGNPEKALSIMDDVLKLQKQLSKKDFANYASYEELLNDLNKIKQPKPSENITEFYRGDIKKGDDLVVIAANTWEASCNYGASSKWCTTAKDSDSYWRRHNKTGTEFFWIFRNKPETDPEHKFSYHIKIDGTEPDWCNAVNRCTPTRRLPENSYPKQHPMYNQIIEKLQEFHNNREGMGDVKSQDERVIISRENKRIVESLIDENDKGIMDVLINHGIQGDLDNIAYNYLGTFISEEIYDFIHEYFDDDDDDYDDMVDDCIDELDEHLQKIEFNFDDDMMNQITRDLSFLVCDVLIDYYNFDEGRYYDEQMQEQDITIVDVIERIVSDYELRYLFDEALHEVADIIIYDKFYDESKVFLENYKK